MATVPRNMEKSLPSPAPARTPEDRDRAQLRRDRLVAALVIGGMVALFGLLIWLASVSDPQPAVDYDLWMMP